MTDRLERMTAVTVQGLQSARGKELNGGYGIICGNPLTYESGTVRYPVQMFALPSQGSSNDEMHNMDLPWPAPKTMKIKAENLIADDNDSQRETVLAEAIKSNTKKATKAAATEDIENELWMFWLELYHHHHPDDYYYALQYAHCIRHFHKDPQQAVKVISEFTPESIPKTDSPEIYGGFLHDICYLYCQAKVQLDRALEFALAIPADTRPGHDMPCDSIQRVMDTCNLLLNDASHFQDPALSQVNLKAAKELYQRQPELRSPHHEISMGQACCLAGNNLEGARWYRQALKHKPDFSNYTPEARDATMQRMQDLRSNIVVAQMSCPGMPLEHHAVLSHSKTHYECLHKDDISQCEIVQTLVGNGQVHNRIKPRGTGSRVNMKLIPIPRGGMDDPAVFTPDFLDMVSAPPSIEE